MQVCGIMGKYKWETLLLFISNKPVTVAVAFVLFSKHIKVLGFLGGLLFSALCSWLSICFSLHWPLLQWDSSKGLSELPVHLLLCLDPISIGFSLLPLHWNYSSQRLQWSPSHWTPCHFSVFKVLDLSTGFGT